MSQGEQIQMSAPIRNHFRGIEPQQMLSKVIEVQRIAPMNGIRQNYRAFIQLHPIYRNIWQISFLNLGNINNLSSL